MEIVNMFFSFLDREGVLLDYLKNFNTYSKEQGTEKPVTEFIKSNNPRDLINVSFIWEYVKYPENAESDSWDMHMYWESIETKWHEFLDHVGF